MKRRDFIRLSALTFLPVLACKPQRNKALPFPVYIDSDRETGHLVLKSMTFPAGEDLETETLIVGGGIAGMGAAFQLKNRGFILCEAGEQLGGSSGSLKLNGNYFSQGAHYDLAYPDTYGKEVLNALQELKLIEFNSRKKQWEFREKQYIIPAETESSCYVDGYYQDELLPDRPETYEFLKVLNRYSGQMPLPTRLISEDLRSLDKLSFTDFLRQENIYLSEPLMRALDYHMRDDYGAPAAEVSALAGIHYYKCRPYYDKQPPELFSPPEGNYYFIRKMAEQLPAEKLKTGHLVRKIEKNGSGFKAKVIDAQNKKTFDIQCKQIVYAGQKHALPYIFPQDEQLFATNQYAPWMAVNIVLKKELPQGFWQNDMLIGDTDFLGFVDSDAQYKQKNAPRVLTAYYCFDRKEREYLAEISDKKEALVSRTLDYISEYFRQDISPAVVSVYIKVMGHAMPIPQPDYLFDDKNKRRSESKLVYAGVDNSRLPLFFEAMDSGIMAVKELDALG